MKAILLLDQVSKRQDRMKNIIMQTLGKTELYLAETAEKAYQILLERTIDIFIIFDEKHYENTVRDVGIRLVLHIREIPRYMFAPVIFVSPFESKERYIFEKLNCIGFLSMYFTDECMIRLLKKASNFETKRNKNELLLFHKSGILYPVKIAEIVYIDQNERKVYVHLANTEIMIMPYVSFAHLLYEADSKCLIMCNRSTVVNKDYIYAIDPVNRYIVLRNGLGMITIGKKYRKSILLEFSGQKRK